MKLLAIDDLQDNLITLKALTATYLPQATLLTALSGLEGIEIARSEQPDTILLDILMPGIDGFETARRLKTDSRTGHIPVILLTALNDDTAKVRGLDAGADAFLAKPINEAELVAQVRCMLRIKRSEDALRQERDNLEQRVREQVREIRESERRNRLLLDAIPHIALLCNREKIIVAMNRTAADAGMKLGDYCWNAILMMERLPEEQRRAFLETGMPLPGTRCRHCLADEALDTTRSTQEELELNGRIFSVWWSPIEDDLFLHYLMDITEQRQAEQANLAALREKEALLKEIHHRVKNNMQIISSLLNLQAGFSGNEALAALLLESQCRIRAMALVHEKLYQSGSLAEVEFDDYLKSLTGYILRSYRGIISNVALRTVAPGITFPVTTTITCGLIVNELVTNALKHAFPDSRQGEIQATVVRNHNATYTLTVADNGVGLPDGFDPEKKETLGLLLVQDLTQQLDGTLAIDRAGGTTCAITFKG
jgi:two-component sensor histidine kinase/DNA-binding response OmpR family regulator